MQETIVVTGGSSGIGRACVRRALTEGRTVVNLDLRPPDLLPGETHLPVDLRDPAAVASAFEVVTAERSIVGLVNNAGFALSKTLQETTPEDFETLVPLNLAAPALCAKLAAASMRTAGWGRIVNISSRVALGKERRTVYAATKGGVTAMARVWALELAAYGITVNTVGPGPIATALFEAVNPPDSAATRQIVESIPVRRLGTPEDIANAVMFFLGRESGFVTGQTIYVCGGLTVGIAGI